MNAMQWVLVGIGLAVLGFIVALLLDTPPDGHLRWTQQEVVDEPAQRSAAPAAVPTETVEAQPPHDDNLLRRYEEMTRELDEYGEQILRRRKHQS
jgi:hypothetical protein